MSHVGIDGLPAEAPVGRPPYVRFETMPIEDRDASIAAGRLIVKDVDFAKVTAIGSKDVAIKEVKAWLEQQRQYAKEERIPGEWPMQYERAYAAWKAGQEVPLNGTPIKGWSAVSAAQQSNIIGANILTVEDLAGITDEGIRRIGMGAMELKDKAIRFLANQSKAVSDGQAKIVILEGEKQALKDEINHLNGKIADQTKTYEAQILTLKQQVATLQMQVPKPGLAKQP